MDGMGSYGRFDGWVIDGWGDYMEVLDGWEIIWKI